MISQNNVNYVHIKIHTLCDINRLLCIHLCIVIINYINEGLIVVKSSRFCCCWF
eukprot:UN06138